MESLSKTLVQPSPFPKAVLHSGKQTREKGTEMQREEGGQEVEEKLRIGQAAPSLGKAGLVRYKTSD